MVNLKAKPRKEEGNFYTVKEFKYYLDEGRLFRTNECSKNYLK